MSETSEKILLLLLGGFALCFSYTPHQQWRVIKTVSREWKKIKKEDLRKGINNLYKTNSIKKKKNTDGSYTIVLTEKGKMRAITYDFLNMKIEHKKWDGKWRIVVFDVPEKIRQGRNALRWKIKKLGFCELQKSVFVFPYECKDEIDFIVEFFGLKGYTYYGTLESIDNDAYLRKSFDLSL